jgi:hypothetical protein
VENPTCSRSILGVKRSLAQTRGSLAALNVGNGVGIATPICPSNRGADIPSRASNGRGASSVVATAKGTLCTTGRQHFRFCRESDMIGDERHDEVAPDAEVTDDFCRPRRRHNLYRVHAQKGRTRSAALHVTLGSCAASTSSFMPGSNSFQRQRPSRFAALSAIRSGVVAPGGAGKGMLPSSQNGIAPPFFVPTAFLSG